MKATTATLLAALYGSAAMGLLVQNPDQTVVDFKQEGFSIDLNEMRLVQFEGQTPVWMSELDKVSCRLSDQPRETPQ